MTYRLFLSSMLAMVFLFLPGPSALAASTWYVNGVSGSDTNTCTSSTAACKTIGHAIGLAASGDTISVAAATYTEDLSISTSLTIDGAGAKTTIVNGHVDLPSSTSTVTLVGMTIQNGTAAFGGGIYNGGGTLTLRNANITGNHASGVIPEGSGIYNGGGALTIISSAVNSNSMLGVPSSGFGGGIYNRGTLTITSSTVSDNGLQDQVGGAFLGGGGIYNVSGKVTITRSTLSGNYLNGAYADGGGTFYGGGIWTGGTMSITSSTINGNYASGDISSAVGGGIDNVGVLTITSSTLSNNSVFGFTQSLGGGIDGNATLQDTIVADNSNGNCQGTIASLGYNLSSDNSCALSGPGDLNNTDPMLGPLQNNGGPTQTQALLTGSPAIDAGDPTGCTDPTGKCLTTDQRGRPQPDPEDAGMGCDIGAYESQTD